MSGLDGSERDLARKRVIPAMIKTIVQRAMRRYMIGCRLFIK